MPRITHLHVWAPEKEFPHSVEKIELDWGGIPGDRHYGEHMTTNSREAHAFPRGSIIKNYRQISLVDVSELNEIARSMELDDLKPGTIGDNICTEGLVHLTATPAMTRMVFPSGASIMTGGENNPCTIAGAMVGARYGTLPHKFPKAAMHLRGITGWVERPGIISVGDSVDVIGLY